MYYKITLRLNYNDFAHDLYGNYRAADELEYIVIPTTYNNNDGVCARTTRCFFPRDGTLRKKK